MSDSGMDKRGASGWDVTFTPAVGGSSNICLVSIQVVDNDDNNIDEPVMLDVWLSDAATGIGVTATTASGAVVAGTSGTLVGTLTSKKALRVLTNAAGLFILSITDTSKTAFYVACSVPFQEGRIAVSDVLTTADYA